MAFAEALRDGFRRDPLTTATAGFLAAFCLLALVGPSLAVQDPLATDAARSLRPPMWQIPCGTDQVGRDICTRIIYAARLDLFIAISAVAIALVAGSALGSFAGYFGGWVDRIAMWIVDTIMAFPLFILAMGIVAALGSSMENIIYATAIVNVPFYARTVRAEINQRREAGFVEAARVAGNGPFRVLAYHLFPTAVPQLAVQMTLTMGWAMLNAASLSFIGLGIRPPAISWGVLLQEAQNIQTLALAPWLLIPGLVVIVAVLAFNLVGDGLRDASDPYSH